jgi:hypothetical protein
LSNEAFELVFTKKRPLASAERSVCKQQQHESAKDYSETIIATIFNSKTEQ